MKADRTNNRRVKEMDKIEDRLVEQIEPVLKKYKDSILKDNNLDFRNFAAYDISKLVIATFFDIAKESPTGTFTFDSNTINIY